MEECINNIIIQNEEAMRINQEVMERILKQLDNNKQG